MSPVRPILPGATLGVLGGGQLGRMFALAAHELGYHVHLFVPETDTPTGQACDRTFVAAYDDLDAVEAFARTVDVVTFEFENVPAATADAAAKHAPIRPAGQVLHLSQNRLREKTALRAAGLPVTPFEAVPSRDTLVAALQRLGAPGILKTAAWGYDGKGQRRIDDASQAIRAWDEVGGGELILERAIPFECELSVVAVRGADGTIACYEPFENDHRNHILDVSLWPARLPRTVRDEAVGIAREVVETLDVVGVSCVEFFLAPGATLLINEIAPRPHNSGHLTIDACVTSQFEQQVRAICGLPLGSTKRRRPAAMANLLGDLWNAGPPPWQRALAFPDVKLHLYGKRSARPGRKMGHLTALADTADAAAARVRAARETLSAAPCGAAGEGSAGMRH